MGGARWGFADVGGARIVFSSCIMTHFDSIIRQIIRCLKPEASDGDVMDVMVVASTAMALKEEREGSVLWRTWFSATAMRRERTYS